MHTYIHIYVHIAMNITIILIEQINNSQVLHICSRAGLTLKAGDVGALVINYVLLSLLSLIT